MGMVSYGTAAKNQHGHLSIGGVDALDLAMRFGTPLYVMDEALIRQNCRRYVQALTRYYPHAAIAYASKAFLCTAMVALIEQESMWLDVVSGGEIVTAMKAHFPMERACFHGNNKSHEEIELALTVGIGRIVVDSLHELEQLAAIAGQMSMRPKILFRLTPGVAAHTHQYISTGQLDSKFGIPIEHGLAMNAVRQALSLPQVELVGFHCHIGSQIFDLEGYRLAARAMISCMAEVQRETGFVATELNMGGGLGVRYTQEDRPETPENLAQAIADVVIATCGQWRLPLPKLFLEPGRSIVAEAGTTLYTIGAIKEIPGVRTYISVDGGMGDNIRPALYQARHDCVVANKMDVAHDRLVTVAGRYCESGDRLLQDVRVANNIAVQDCLAVFATGAYNYAMASHYNRYPKPAVVFVADGQADLVVRRESFEEMALYDLLPDRIAKPRLAL